MHCLIVGGGVIGLSLARVLAGRGVRVTVIDRGPLAKEASWAGAGILPPTNAATAMHPLEQLRAMANDLHPQWAEELAEETGVDNGYRRCGGMYLARSIGEAASLIGLRGLLEEEQVPVEKLTPKQVVAYEPALAPLVESGGLHGAFRTPGETQIRNPDHLKALIASCEKRGVELRPHVEAIRFESSGDRISLVETNAGALPVDHVAITSGAWSQRLLAQLEVTTGILPIKGQMILYKLPSKLFTHVLNQGPRYLVPRDDGRVLAGSTEEEEGFDKSNTEEGLQDLRAFAEAILPPLATAKIEQQWAGLRPGTFDGFPYMGPVPPFDNAFAIAGHYRSGLHLSPAVAMELSAIITGHPSTIDFRPFAVGRG